MWCCCLTCPQLCEPNSEARVGSMAKRVLTVGDGDLSFSLALCRAFGESVQMIASTFLSREDVCQRYKSASSTLEELVSIGACVLHGVDACRLEKLKELGCPTPLDVIIFNFPHLGDVAADCHNPDSQHVEQHRALLSHFLHSARSVTSEVQVTLCGEQASLWNLQNTAIRLAWKESRSLAGEKGLDLKKGVD